MLTEQEKQEIRKRLEEREFTNKLTNFPHPLTDNPWNPFQQDQDDLKRVLNALDEQDREVGRWRDLATDRFKRLKSAVKDLDKLEKESQCLRKALMKIASECECDDYCCSCNSISYICLRDIAIKALDESK